MHWKQWDTPPKYFRPSDAWECGRLRSGQPCPCGPDADGRCRAKNTETDTEAEAPCKPRRSLWWRRRRLARAGGLFVAGLLVLIVLSGGEKEFLAPGELTSPHAQILSHHTTENRCAACHELNATESVVAFLAKSWSGHVVDRQQQSIKCLECHQQSLPNANEFSPHDLPDTALVELTRKGSAATRLTSLAAALPSQHLTGNELACSACHVEHQGRWHDLTQLSNERCQSCHTNRFASFTQGHPQFTDYPAHREPRISFNHQSHLTKHFASKGKAFDCRSCHLDESQPSAVGPIGRSVAYEKACASCHDTPLRSSFSDGILVINLPSFDREKIEAAGLSLGNWPEEASLMTDGSLSPMLRWLLSGTADGKTLLAKLPTNGNVSDLSMTDVESLKLQVELAAAIRSLVEELAIGGQPALQKRLSASMARADQRATSADTQEVVGADSIEPAARLSSGVSPDIFRQAWKSWFEVKSESFAEIDFPKSPVASISFGTPNVENEIQTNQHTASLDDPLLNRSADPLLGDSEDPLVQGSVEFGGPGKKGSKIEAMPHFSPHTHLPQGGWLVDQRRLAIVYVPVGHADNTVKAWLTAATAQQAETNSTHFHEILAPKAMGACTECHQLASPSYTQRDDRYLWHAHESDPAQRSFTRFNHVPHLTLPQLNQCTSCHSLQEDGRFKPMQLQNCMDCHTKQGAGDSCTQCHNYHIKLSR